MWAQTLNRGLRFQPPHSDERGVIRTLAFVLRDEAECLKNACLERNSLHSHPIDQIKQI